MPKPQYGWHHQKARRIALDQFREGDICWRCGRPMYSWQRLDLDHIRPVMLGGADGPTRLVHAKCNRSDGARIGNVMRNKRKRITRRKTLPKW